MGCTHSTAASYAADPILPADEEKQAIPTKQVPTPPPSSTSFDHGSNHTVNSFLQKQHSSSTVGTAPSSRAFTLTRDSLGSSTSSGFSSRRLSLKGDSAASKKVTTVAGGGNGATPLFTTIGGRPDFLVERHMDAHRDYNYLEQIGSGSIGNIYLVTRKLTSFLKGRSASLLYCRRFLLEKYERKQRKQSQRKVQDKLREMFHDADESPYVAEQDEIAAASSSSDFMAALRNANESDVEAVTVRHPPCCFALKEIDVALLTEVTLAELRNEIDILRWLDHPNIIKIHETYVFEDEDAYAATFESTEPLQSTCSVGAPSRTNDDRTTSERHEDADSARRSESAQERPSSPPPPLPIQIETVTKTRTLISLVMEFCSGGDLRKRAPYSEAEAQRIVASILKAVNYLHQNGIMHGDIKCENIMFESPDPDAEIRLIDFGLAKRFQVESKKGKKCLRLELQSSSPSKADNKFHDNQGTVYTMAPEVLEGEYDHRADLWSVGIIAYELLTGEMPFWSEEPFEIAQLIVQGKYKSLDDRKNLSWQAKDFVAKLLQVVPQHRYTAEQALKSPWLCKCTKRSKPTPDALHFLSQCFSAPFLTDADARPLLCEVRRLAMPAVARKINAHSSSTARRLRQLFLSLDLNHNGTLSVLELKKALWSLQLCSSQAVDAWFRYARVFSGSVDDGMVGGKQLGGSSEITYSQFMAAAVTTLSCGRKSHLRLDNIATGFDTLDREGKGYITADNLRQLAGARSVSTVAPFDFAAALVNQVDTVNDRFQRMVTEASSNGSYVSFTDFKRVCHDAGTHELDLSRATDESSSEMEAISSSQAFVFTRTN